MRSVDEIEIVLRSIHAGLLFSENTSVCVTFDCDPISIMCQCFKLQVRGEDGELETRILSLMIDPHPREEVEGYHNPDPIPERRVSVAMASFDIK